MNKHQVYMNIANEFKKLSKCQFTQVACIFVDETGGIISSGVNGTVSGAKNCCDHHFEEREDHKHFSNEYEIHAEMNAILRLARSGAKPSHLTIYSTLSPCSNCLKHLLGLQSSGQLTIDKIVFGGRYHRYTDLDIQKMKVYCALFDVELLSVDEAVFQDNQL